MENRSSEGTGDFSIVYSVQTGSGPRPVFCAVHIMGPPCENKDRGRRLTAHISLMRRPIPWLSETSSSGKQGEISILITGQETFNNRNDKDRTYIKPLVPSNQHGRC
jgi:hypothetical protein